MNFAQEYFSSMDYDYLAILFLRDNHHITPLQRDVLFQMFLFGHLIIIKA